MDWATTVKTTRLRMGLKQSALAEVLNLDQATVSRWERSATTPSVGVQRSILNRMSTMDPDGQPLQALLGEVVVSKNAVVLTEPYSFLTVAASASAQAHLELKEARYDWASHPKTPHQAFIYDQLIPDGRILRDRTITHIESFVNLRLPSGRIVRNTAIYYLVFTGEVGPRFLISLLHKEPECPSPGRLIIHRLTRPPQKLLMC
jgi:transcriptional regulator with XRE-family HTH domain